jgi:queuine tRNA-ribosyltransferase
MSPLRFTVVAHSAACGARVGRVETPHGSFDTPAFMPVGSRAAVRGVTPQQLRDTGARIVLANAFHLMLRPGEEVVRELRGLHGFMGWDGPILTDSGGYQAFSMSDLSRVDDGGVEFRSAVDGGTVHLGPERAMAVQNALGADIVMAFDDCPPAAGADRARLAAAHERTARWLRRCVRAHRRPQEQALFGIVQGGTDAILRRASVEAVCEVELPGYAVGGVAVGESPEEIRRVVELTVPLLPPRKPRYVMGIGYERDILMAVRAGADLFDCVLPTRNGRNAAAFTRHGIVHLRNACHRTDPGPIEPGCDCAACAGGLGRAYLRHLFLAGEMLGPVLASLHNLRHFQRLLLDIHRAIREDSWLVLERDWPILADPARPGERLVPA